jgi:hypothetical protein
MPGVGTVSRFKSSQKKQRHVVVKQKREKEKE